MTRISSGILSSLVGLPHTSSCSIASPGEHPISIPHIAAFPVSLPDHAPTSEIPPFAAFLFLLSSQPNLALSVSSRLGRDLFHKQQIRLVFKSRIVSLDPLLQSWTDIFAGESGCRVSPGYQQSLTRNLAGDLGCREVENDLLLRSPSKIALDDLEVMPTDCYYCVPDGILILD